MAKKNRPETEESAFESAIAAFDRVGEDYVPASKAVELSKTEEPAAEPETSVDAAETVDAPVTPETPVSEPDAPDVPDAEPDTPEASDAETAAPETSVDAAETVDAPVTPETPVSEPDAPDASADTPDVPDAEPDTPEASDAETAAPETSDDAEPVDDSPAPEPDSAGDSEPADRETETPGDVADWDDEPDEPEEVTEMEKHTMETKEITLGVHRSPPPVTDTEPDETETIQEKRKPHFKAFEQLKDALRSRAEAGEQAEEAPATGSSRDAALRKRVMQIEDEETRNYLLDRVLPQMIWYGKRSDQYRTNYYRLMAATILLGALIPAFSVGGSYAAIKVIIALLGASVTGINAYMALYNYHDLWITYQKTREDLIHLLYCYFNNAGVFAQKKMSEKDLNVLLVDVCEDALSKETGGWTTIVQKT